MPVFVYSGTNRAGGRVNGEQTAENKAEVINLLKRQQIKVSKMSEKGKEFNMPTFGGGVNAKDLAVFTRQFSVMIDAGLPLVQCLEILAGQQENKIFQKVLTSTRSSVEGGTTLSAAMRRARKGFRSAVRQPGGSGRNRRYPGHHSPAPGELHREKRQAETRRAFRAGVPGSGFAGGRWRDHAAVVEGGADFRDAVHRIGRRFAPADAYCDRAEQFRGQHLWAADRGRFSWAQPSG